ncbi:CHY zinc finger protein [Gracilibacillus dipsosauri]|uniref:CHY-type domain-containing protein n=1 Tax=Gracilibacillus dipsosauri TaxID=178340 RepID=A0A317L631_9BACI|nr:CHY zinc finger protein [Gracilibacillus dipsosauri]PWU70358.1 hypothetical protein DLJ74_00525 [Gracilibacillus dipsosauri]
MPKIYGLTVDNQTRCKHYHNVKDIIAIKFKCCHKFYPCYKCHQECENHSIELWSAKEREEKAIICGVCGVELTINQYINTNHCLHCKSRFNERCENHYHLYFE